MTFAVHPCRFSSRSTGMHQFAHEDAQGGDFLPSLLDLRREPVPVSFEGPDVAVPFLCVHSLIPWHGGLACMY